MSDQKLKEIVEIAQKRSPPAFDIVSNPTPVYVNVEREYYSKVIAKYFLFSFPIFDFGESILVYQIIKILNRL